MKRDFHSQKGLTIRDLQLSVGEKIGGLKSAKGINITPGAPKNHEEFWGWHLVLEVGGFATATGRGSPINLNQGKSIILVVIRMNQCKELYTTKLVDIYTKK